MYVCEACDYANTLNNKNFNKGLKELRNVIKKALKESKISKYKEKITEDAAGGQPQQIEYGRRRT